MLVKQTLYESWTLRRRRLDEPGRRIDPICRKEQIRILDGLLKEYRGQPAANRPAQFPASIESASARRWPFAIRLSRPTNPQRHALELAAHERIEPVVNHIHTIDPQSACSIPKVAFFDILIDQPTMPQTHKPTPPALPAPNQPEDVLPKLPPENLCTRILHADLVATIRELAEAALTKLPSLLLMEVSPTRALNQVVGLAARYTSGMCNLFFRSDTRNAMDYMMHEIEHDRIDNPQTNSSEGPTAEAPARTESSQPLYFDQCAILLHEYASHTDGRQRDSDALIQIVNRVAHTSANAGIVVTPWKNEAPESGFMFYLNSLPPQELGKFIEEFTERAIDFNGRMGESIASAMERRTALGDDVLKAFYFNLACASRALHLIPLACAERAAEGADALIRDQAAEFFSRSDYRTRALDRFRVELADGDPSVRAVAIEMLSQIGTLDDVGLLLDVAELPSHGQRLPRERRTLLRGAATLAGRLKANEVPSTDSSVICA